MSAISLLLLLVLVLGSLVHCDSLQALDNDPSWGYLDGIPGKFGPTDWHRVPHSGVCLRGTFQSPINIASMATRIASENGPIRLRYQPLAGLKLRNDGHSVSLSAGANSPEVNGFDLPGLLYSPFGYRLWGLHPHWGQNNSVGSEHTLDQQRFPFEMHYIHYNSKFSSAAAAIASGEHDALVVFAVFHRVGDTSPQPIVALRDGLRQVTRVGAEFSVRTMLNLSNAFPERGLEYFTYLGSLTTPSCTQVVRWIVFARPQSILQSDLDLFRNISLSSNTTAAPGSNYRPLQNSRGRRVTSSFWTLEKIEDYNSGALVTMGPVVLALLVALLAALL